MRRFGASNARRCARPGEVIAPMVMATTRSAIPKRDQAYVALNAPIAFRANSAATTTATRPAKTATTPRGQRELPGHASGSPKHEKNAANDAIDLSRHEPMQRDRGDQPCDAFRLPQGNGGNSERD